MCGLVEEAEDHPYVAVLSPNYAKAAVFDVIWVYQRDRRCFTEFKISSGRRHRTRTCLHWFENVPQKRLPETGLAGHIRVQRTFVGS